MSDDLYFDGDPAVDSRRRHMERVLKGTPRRKWPWIVACVAGGGAWAAWRLLKPLVPPGQAGEEPRAHPAAARDSTQR
jgi:hypothetical protein